MLQAWCRQRREKVLNSINPESSNGHYKVRVRDICRLLKKTPSELAADCPGELVDPVKNWNGLLEASVVRKLLECCGITVKPKILAFLNLKGGVGKTTSALAVGSRAAQLGFRTCIVDMDAQASATMALGGPAEHEDFPVFYDVWQNPAMALDSALVEISDGLFCLPSSLQNSMLDVALSSPVAQKGAVLGVCRELRRKGYDIIILDCPPSLGGAVISTICAADILVIPAACDMFSMRGIKLTCKEAEAIRQTFGLPEPVIRILPTMLDQRKRLTGEMMASLRAEYGDRVLEPGISTSSVMSKELENCRTLYATDVPRSDVHDRYDRIVDNLLELGLPNCMKEDVSLC